MYVQTKSDKVQWLLWAEQIIDLALLASYVVSRLTEQNEKG